MRRWRAAAVGIAVCAVMTSVSIPVAHASVSERVVFDPRGDAVSTGTDAPAARASDDVRRVVLRRGSRFVKVIFRTDEFTDHVGRHGTLHFVTYFDDPDSEYRQYRIYVDIAGSRDLQPSDTRPAEIGGRRVWEYLGVTYVNRRGESTEVACPSHRIIVRPARKIWVERARPTCLRKLTFSFDLAGARSREASPTNRYPYRVDDWFGPRV